MVSGTTLFPPTAPDYSLPPRTSLALPHHRKRPITQGYITFCFKKPAACIAGHANLQQTSSISRLTVRFRYPTSARRVKEKGKTFLIFWLTRFFTILWPGFLPAFTAAAPRAPNSLPKRGDGFRTSTVKGRNVTRMRGKRESRETETTRSRYHLSVVLPVFKFALSLL